MEKILNQEEINSLFRAPQKCTVSEAASRKPQTTITRFNVREIGQLNKEQVRALSTLHESSRATSPTRSECTRAWDLTQIWFPSCS